MVSTGTRGSLGWREVCVCGRPGTAGSVVLPDKGLWQDSIPGAQTLVLPVTSPHPAPPNPLQVACSPAGLMGTRKRQACSSPSQGTTELMAACVEARAGREYRGGLRVPCSGLIWGL